METIVNGFVKITGFEEKERNAIEMIASTLEENNVFPDITFKFSDGRILRGHKYMLYWDSKYFKDLFDEHKDIKEVDMTTIKVLANYDAFVLYLGMVYMPSPANIFDIYNTWYNFFELIEYIESRIYKIYIVYNELNIGGIYQLINYYASNKYYMYYHYIRDAITTMYDYVESIEINYFSLGGLYVFLNEFKCVYDYENKKNVLFTIICSKINDKTNPVHIDLIVFMFDSIKIPIPDDLLKKCDIDRLLRIYQPIYDHSHLMEFYIKMKK